MHVKQVQAYETTDSQLFTEKCAAEAHQKDLDLKAALQAFVDSRCNSNMNGSDVYDILYDNRDDLRRILG